MEVIRSRKIKEIFLDNGNWLQVFLRYKDLIRDDIIINVIKFIACGTPYLGCHVYQCPNCTCTKTVFHTCKSRFCSSCGKKATDNWIDSHLKLLPKTTYQHVTFTFPQQLQAVFWLNRDLINKMMPLPAQIMTAYSRRLGVIPGIFVALHTFGRDLKRNVHFHLSLTLSGLSLDKTKWMPRMRFNRPALKVIKEIWRDNILQLLRNEHLAGNLILPKHFLDINNPNAFIEWLDKQGDQKWVVHFSKPSNDHKKNVEYLGRYLKRPPIGETRIKHYDGEYVTYVYYDHHDKKTYTLTLPVFDFIKRLISHIPDRYFNVIRYYGWLSNRTRGQHLPFIYEKLGQIVKKAIALSWRALIIRTFGIDPLLCQICKQATLVLQQCIYTHNIKQLFGLHVQVVDPNNH